MRDFVIGPRTRSRREPGSIDVVGHRDPDHYDIIPKIGTAAGACTGNVPFNSSRYKSVPISSRA